MGEAGMLDRSSRPHHSPNKTPRRLVRKVVHLRWKKRLGPVGIGAQLGMPASTVHTVLSRCRINRPSHVDVRTGEPARRYEHEHPGSMIHVDIKKLGNIPDGGGWRYVGRLQGERNKAITAKRTGKHGITGDMITGTAFVHTVIDDHSRPISPSSIASSIWLSTPERRAGHSRRTASGHGITSTAPASR
ncbi:transposase, ISlxx4 [Leifsonia xyli subsp. cynodontis DSM 46306]|uniref:Uncharacterized protein n=1 Tax=Leifsonia xyli subsp. cynodontis DSM 46306 TaxID=1389489 RepID=U3PBV4_LEIXC|nr:transposase, ISlxx4 [Leifsonia xyli subsp. cynodontis DSM 46306]